MNNVCQIEKGEETPTNNDVSTDHLQEAKYQWNMTKEMGVTCGTDHESIIDRIWAMEKRDRKEAEKLGNKNVIL